MDISSLKLNRFMIPGIIIFVFTFLTLNDHIKGFQDICNTVSNFNLEDLIYVGPIIIFSIIYYSLNLRNILWNPFYKRIVNNIKTKFLLSISDQITFGKAQELLDIKNKKIMNIFYSFIDSDASLSERANIVRFNGLIWSSCIDSAIISAFFCIVCLVKWLFVAKTNYTAALGYVYMLISWFSFYLVFVLTNRHLALSNDQITYIVDEKNDELIQKMEKLNGDK